MSETKLRAIYDATPSEGVVHCLERMLERARAGELRGVVVAFDAKGVHGHAMAWEPEVTSLSLVGELQVAQLSILMATGRLY